MTVETVEDKMAAIRFGADDGHPESMFLLGIAYSLGRGTDRDDTEAARWFHEASRRGHTRAKASLGYMYAIGRGVRHDVILGFIFLTEAASKGDLLAPDLLTKLRRQMSPIQIKEANKRTKNRRIS